MEGKTGHPKRYAKKTPFTSRGIRLDVYVNFCHCHFIIKLTPPKTKMEPENEALEDEIPIGNPSFSGSMFVFGGVL